VGGAGALARCRRLDERLSVDGISRASRILAISCLRERVLRGALINKCESRGNRIDEWGQLDRDHRTSRSMDRSDFWRWSLCGSEFGRTDRHFNERNAVDERVGHDNLDFTSVAYGNGHFVASDAALGAIAISTNGVDWSRIFPAPNTTAHWGAIVYGEGEFVAFDGGDSGYIVTSVHASVWSPQQVSPAQETDGAAFGCGSFVGVGTSALSGGSFITSTSVRRGRPPQCRLMRRRTGPLSATALNVSLRSMPRQHCMVKHNKQLFRGSPRVTATSLGKH